MYRNFSNPSPSSEPSFSGMSESHTGVCENDSLDTRASSTEQKFPGTSTSQFVPSLNTITSSQDLQWLLQPSLLASPGPPRFHLSHTHTHPLTHTHVPRPGVIRAVGGGETSRRRNEEYLTPEELERRRIRRERNKMAAAKCRNRRRELTDMLQNETEQLETEKTTLQKEIAELQKEKEKLELVLEAHRPICKIQDSDSDSDSSSGTPSLGTVKLELQSCDAPGPSSAAQPKVQKSKPKPQIQLPPAAHNESESLHTPVLISTPSLTPFTSSMVFTYPSSSTSQHPNLPSQSQRACGAAHRRSSSSGDQSDHSLNSPTILSL